LVELGRFAASELEYLSEILEKFFELYGIVFGSDIGRSVIDSSLGQYDLWKLFFGDFDVGIAVVCLEEIVVQWLMLFDEVVF
jgi:hypothetical protein